MVVVNMLFFMILYGLLGIGKIFIVFVIVGIIKYVFCIFNVIVDSKKCF